MKYWISASGGLGSAISCILAHERNLDFEMIFADTLIEDQDLYRFLWQVAISIGKEIIYLKDGRTPYDIFVDTKYIGNSRVAACSRILKTEVIKGYLEKNSNPGDVLVLGMDLWEQDRIDRAAKNWTPRPVMSLLNEFKCWRPQWDEILERYGIQKPSLYSLGFPHNNCGGGCVRAGQQQWLTLLLTKPERYAWHETQLEEAMKKIGKTAKPFLRVTFEGHLIYVTLKQFRRMVEAKLIKVDPFDIGGCGCFVDEEK